MTKEAFSHVCEIIQNGYSVNILDNFNKFLESNVCIPKGANRHPYADLLHEWIEGYTECIFTHPNGSYRGTAKQIFTEYGNFKIEVYKPSEPVYEYQWVYGQRGNSSRSARLSEHCTINELFTKFTDDLDVYFYMPVDETKRERRQ